MVKLNIEGRKVTIDDSFLQMSPEEQHAKVDMIAKKLKLTPSGQAPGTPTAVTGNGPIDNALHPITSYPETYSRMNREATDHMSRGFDQMTHPDSLTDPQAHGLYDVLAGAANMGLGAVEFVGSPVNAAIHTIAGQPIEENTGLPSQYTDFAASLALPIPKRLPRMPRIGEEAATQGRVAEGPLGVTLSEGQTTRDLSAIQREQAAVRGQSGPPAQQHAQAFFDQQKAELEAAREKINTGLDPVGGQRLAESPQAAGELVSEQLQRTAAQRKAGVTQAYDRAKAFGGEIEARAFDDVAGRIKTDLSNRTEPIVIDDKLTPFASHAIKDVDERVARLRIQNRASPHGAPDRAEIVGINLEGIEQMRKRLSSFRKDAYGSGNAADGRAAQAVLDAFDSHIEQAINSGAFKGDPRAVQAWNTARAAHADYKATFSAGKNDPIGRVVEKILGTRNNPAAIANDVADFMYGSAGTNPSSINVGVTQRLKKTFGEQSPEWAAIKQGLWSRLAEAGEGATEFGAGKVAQRLNKFLNADGKEMANIVFSGAERDMLKQYADLMRAIEVPQAGANWSNTATFAAKALDRIGSNVGMTIGATIGSALGHGAGLPMGLAEAIGGSAGAGIAKGAGIASNAMQARKIAKQMPVIAKVMTDYRAAAVAFETSPSARTVARLSLASRNLSTNLKDIGISFSPENLMRMIQGPGRAGADPGQGTADQKQP
jgi:hypothetical protein